MQVVRDEITEMRDLNEHWKDNAPVFNVRPRPGQPKRPTGRAFVARNPDGGPYWWLAWDSQAGPKLSPNVPAAAVRELLDRVQTRVPGLTPVSDSRAGVMAVLWARRVSGRRVCAQEPGGI
jgi:hypothetical protein